MSEVLNLYFNGDDFTNFISFVKTMNAKDKSKYAKVIMLHVENKHLVCRAIDDTSNYFEYHVELYNDNNIIEEPIIVSISDVAALIKCANSNKFAIRKNFNQYEFNILGGGWLPFKTLEIETDKFAVKGDITDIGTINSVKLRNAISSVLGYTQEYTYTRDKFIQFTKDQMVVTSRRSVVITSDQFIDMTLHRDVAALLKTLLKENFDLNVSKVSSEKEMLMFTGPKFKYVIVASEIDSVDANYSNDIENYIKINCDELYKLCLFSEEYSASKHILGITVKNGELNVSVKNVLAAKHVSTIKSKAVGDVKDVLTEAEIPTHILLKALKLFQDKRSREVNIYITDEMLKDSNTIILFDDNTQAVIDIYSR